MRGATKSIVVRNLKWDLKFMLPMRGATDSHEPKTSKRGL